MDNGNNHLLLSICIPTYNRGEVLDATLNTYVHDPAFDERVEIVISDNASTDNTQQLVEPYLKKYPNITYQQQPHNIGAGFNMSTVLAMGHGTYLKLMNDSVTMKQGVLATIIQQLHLHSQQKLPIFFYQNINFLHINETIRCTGINAFVSNTSFWITWIANFGIWKTNFDRLEDKDKLALLQFPQTDWTLRTVDTSQIVTLHFGDFYAHSPLTSKGGYNYFNTFGVKYLHVYDEAKATGRMSKRVYRLEKHRLFTHSLKPWYNTLIINKESTFVFETKNAFRLLLINYRCYPYFYSNILYLYIRRLLRICFRRTHQQVPSNP